MRETHFRAETAVSETQRIVMLNAYNNDIEYNKRWYHIQTEDNGLTNGHITTTVFHSGQTLDSKTISYLDFVKGISDENEINNIVKEKMTEQHKFKHATRHFTDHCACCASLHAVDQSAKIADRSASYFCWQTGWRTLGFATHS